MRRLREFAKDTVGTAIFHATPRCRYENSVFILAHMRCGSTALSNIFCSRDDISGYGESHTDYSKRARLGRLQLKHLTRRAWKPGATSLFDKILHSAHDRGAPPEFFTAKAVFLARDPRVTIRSIRKLFENGPDPIYRTDEEAARYYIQRVTDLTRLWARFEAGRRIGLTHEELLADPEAQLARISDALGIRPRLANAYRSRAAIQRHGDGDPVDSIRFNRIERRLTAAETPEPLNLPDRMLADAMAAYEGYVATIRGDGKPRSGTRQRRETRS